MTTNEISWNLEKAASIDWTDPLEILVNHFTFLDIVSLHPSLASHYYPHLSCSNTTVSPATNLTSLAPTSRSSGKEEQTSLPDEEKLREERKVLKKLFLHHSSLEEAEIEQQEEAAFCMYSKKRRMEKEGEEGMCSDLCGVSKSTVMSCSKTEEKVRILMEWARQGLFTLRTARWCRKCGGEGHSMKSCPMVVPTVGGIADAIPSPLLREGAPVSPEQRTVGIEKEKKENEYDASAASLGHVLPSALSPPRSVLRKYQDHQVCLARKRLLEEKTSKLQRLEQRPQRAILQSNMTPISASNCGSASSSLLAPTRVSSPGNLDKPIEGTRGGVQGPLSTSRELELFSDERCRGVVERLEVNHNIGFVRTIRASSTSSSSSSNSMGPGEGFKFFVDRSDSGVKPLQVGARVTFKIDRGREFPIASDVRVESPVVTAEDVKMLVRRCRVAGMNRMHSMNIITMLVSHVTEWQDVLVHFYRDMVSWKECRAKLPRGQAESSEGTIVMASSTASALFSDPPNGSRAITIHDLPLWISHVQAIVELTTFYTNREPLHRNILAAFLLLLVSPVSVSFVPSPPPQVAAGESRNSEAPSLLAPRLHRCPPSTTSSTSFSFMKDLFTSYVTFWEVEIVTPHIASSSSSVASSMRKDGSAGDADASPSPTSETFVWESEEEEEKWIAAVTDALCESADLIVLVQQHTTERNAPTQYFTRLCVSLRSTLYSLWEYANARAGRKYRQNVPNGRKMTQAAARRLHTGFTRLDKVSSFPVDVEKVRDSSSSSAPSLSLFPTADELSIPPSYGGSVFHPSQLPVYFIAEKSETNHQCMGNRNAEQEETAHSDAGNGDARQITASALQEQREQRLQEEEDDGALHSGLLPPSLPPSGSSAPSSSPYDSTEAFIFSHCQLLRADTFESTARLLSATCFDRKQYPPSEETQSDAAHVALYDHVKFMGRVLPRDHDYAHPTGYLFQVQAKSPQASWTNRLRQGTCVCFVTALSTEWVTPDSDGSPSSTVHSSSSFSSSSTSVLPKMEGLALSSELFWGTISSCDAVLLQAGIICVEPCVVSTSDVTPPPPFSQLVANLSRNAVQHRLDRCVMMETSIFYPGYASIMNSLKAFLEPFSMRLPHSERLRGPGRQKVNLSSPTHRALLPYIPPQCSQAFSKIIGSIRKSFPLDKGQEQVLTLLPYEEILLVQGPPGTGKSFIGCRVVETYVRYKQMIESGDILQHLSIADFGSELFFPKCSVPSSSSSSFSSPSFISTSATRGGVGEAVREKNGPFPSSLTPIVVITYKNHALDEFLVDLLKSKLWGDGETSFLENESRTGSGNGSQFFPGGARLIRIGGRSKEERLAPYNLSSLMREGGRKSVVARYREHIGLLHQRLDRLTKEVQYLEQGRVPKSYFEKWLTAEQRKHMQYEDREEWLLGGRYIGSATGAASNEKVDRNYYKTLLQSSLGAALERPSVPPSLEKEEEGNALGEVSDIPVHASSSTLELRKEKRKRSVERGVEKEGSVDTAESSPMSTKSKWSEDTLSTKKGSEKRGGEDKKWEPFRGENEMVVPVGAEEEGENEGNEEVVRSVFQEMKWEEESREYNNRLHLTALSPEAIYFAHHPPKELPMNVPSGLQSLWSLDPITRHHYYAYLIQKTISEKAMHCFQIMARISNFLTIRNHANDMAKLSLLQSADVVGLTTTGCAMNQDLLRSLRPRVLVVEEAAEVLECQLLACMTDSLEQIILIGDHFQLQPKVETFAYEKINHMNLSLFERLTGHIPVIRLTEQRRMHPVLSQLIRPYYNDQELLDHFSLISRPLLTAACYPCVDYVPGLAKRVFFWRHQYPEEQAPGGSRSKVNSQEVQMVYQAVSHMVGQGLMQRSITVITPYLGQRRLLRRHLRLSQLGDVRVSTVDLFQGDESDVIILSLVRTERLTDFLQTKNRLVVSCSRARFGMVIIGNDKILMKCEHWATLLRELHRIHCIGDALPVTVQTFAATENENSSSIAELRRIRDKRKVRYLLPKSPSAKEERNKTGNE